MMDGNSCAQSSRAVVDQIVPFLTSVSRVSPLPSCVVVAPVSRFSLGGVNDGTSAAFW